MYKWCRNIWFGRMEENDKMTSKMLQGQKDDDDADSPRPK